MVEAGYQMQTIVQLAPSRAVVTAVHEMPQAVDAWVLDPTEAELQHDDARAKRIARSGAKTIARAASSGAAACYMQLVLQEYSMRLTGEVSHEL